MFVYSEALDMYLSVGILRVPEGLDYSHVIEEEDQMTPQQLIDIKKNNKEKDIVRNQSEGQLSQGKSTIIRRTSFHDCFGKLEMMMIYNVVRRVGLHISTHIYLFEWHSVSSIFS
jgi:hypothetical protein